MATDPTEQTNALLTEITGQLDTLIQVQRDVDDFMKPYFDLIANQLNAINNEPAGLIMGRVYDLYVHFILFNFLCAIIILMICLSIYDEIPYILAKTENISGEILDLKADIIEKKYFENGNQGMT